MFIVVRPTKGWAASRKKWSSSMLNQKCWTLTRLFGVLAILTLAAVQQPASATAAEMQPCWGSPGCWVCVGSGGDGDICIIRYCHGDVEYTCL